MPLTKLRAFLDSHHIPYTVISHSVAYTAQGIAATAHISGKELAKTVVLKIDGKLAMAVLPASTLVDLPSLKNAAGARELWRMNLSSRTIFQIARPARCRPLATCTTWPFSSTKA